MHTGWHEEIMPSPGNSIRGRMAIFNSTIHPTCAALNSADSSVACARMQNCEIPEATVSAEKRKIAQGRAKKKGRVEALPARTLVPPMVPTRLVYHTTWNHGPLKFGIAAANEDFLLPAFRVFDYRELVSAYRI